MAKSEYLVALPDQKLQVTSDSSILFYMNISLIAFITTLTPLVKIWLPNVQEWDSFIFWNSWLAMCIIFWFYMNTWQCVQHFLYASQAMCTILWFYKSSWQCVQCSGFICLPGKVLLFFEAKGGQVKIVKTNCIHVALGYKRKTQSDCF